jgi:hypothetical protein
VRAAREPRLDRGLVTACTRLAFYRLLDQWANRFGVESMLEGPVDGFEGVPGVHGVGLARRGVLVSSFVRTPAAAQAARAIHDASGGAAHAQVDVVPDDPRRVELPSRDMVVAYDALVRAPDWRAHLALLAKRARKILVVTVTNPESWGARARRLVGRPTSRADDEQDVLVAELWVLGRVRDHVYFPRLWRPGVRGLLMDLGPARAGHVYGPERWPYFGGPGWADELEPDVRGLDAVGALWGHPQIRGGPASAWPRRLAPMHAFVVDVQPRTPQARRRLVHA